MAAYISFQPKDYFNTVKYSGTGSTQSITGVGLQADLTWIKGSDYVSNHPTYDSVRGVLKTVMPNQADEETTDSGSLTAWGSDGFTVGNAGASNGSGHTYVAWNWKAGTTSGLTGGTITPSAYSYNTTSKFGIYKYTGTGSNATIAHMLGVKPTSIFIKRLDTSYAWAVYHQSLTSALYHLELNNADAQASAADFWNSTEPTSTVFSIGTGAAVNLSGGTYVAYVFSDVKGYFKTGEIATNGNADGNFIYTGGEPEFIIIKNKTSGGPAGYGYTMMSNTFGMNGATTTNPSYNQLTQHFFADQGIAATTGADADFLSNGFKLRGTGTNYNQASGYFVYWCWNRKPIVSSNSKAGTAR